MKRFSINFGNGRCLIFDWDFKFPLSIRLGFYGKRAAKEMEKLREKLGSGHG